MNRALLEYTRTLVVIAIAAVFLIVLAASTAWQLSDTPAWMMYAAWAVDAQQRTPYVDLLDHHPPGAIAAYMLAGRVFGYSLAGARFADLACMLATLSLLWGIVRWHGKTAAIGAVAIAGLVHTRGIYMLEREAIAMLPVLVAVHALQSPALVPRAGALVAGIAFGFTAWIKPTLAIAWPFVILWLWRRDRSRSPLAAFAVGLALPAAVAVLYLAATGSLGAFLDMATHLWPAYAGYAPESLGLTPLSVATPLRWLAPAAVGAWLAWPADRRQRDTMTLLVVLAVAYAIYPALGHFWANEWLPLQYITIALAAGLLVAAPQAPVPRLVALVCFLAFLGRYVWLPDEFWRQAATGSAHASALEDSLATASVLAGRGGPALRVQPLDYNDGALTVMLAARSTLATSFIWDPSALPDSPYVRSLRERLFAELTAHPPDILLWSEYSIASGTNTGNETYRGLEAFMRGYRPIRRSGSLVVFERQAVAGARPPDRAPDPRGANSAGR